MNITAVWMGDAQPMFTKQTIFSKLSTANGAPIRDRTSRCNLQKVLPSGGCGSFRLLVDAISLQIPLVSLLAHMHGVDIVPPNLYQEGLNTILASPVFENRQ